MASASRHRWLRWLLWPLGVLLGLLLAATAALQTPWARDLVRQRINALLAPVFQGKLEIERLGRLGLWGVGGVDARIFDPQRRQVIRAQGLEARAALPGLVWQLLAEDSLRIELDSVTIDYADVTLREDEDFGVTLARAFLPVESDSAPEAQETDQGSVELYIDRIAIARVWAHGSPAGSPPLDVDLTALSANLSQTRTGFALELDGATLAARALPGDLAARGDVWGSIHVPQDEDLPLRLEGYLDGNLGGSPLWLEASWIGDDLYGSLRAPKIAAELVNARVPALRLQGELSLLAEVEGALPDLDVTAAVDGRAGRVSLTGSVLLDGSLEAYATLAAARVDLAEVADSAPQTDLRVLAHAMLVEEEAGGFAVSHRVEVDAGNVAKVATPPARVRGRLEVTAAGGLDGSGQWALEEQGARATGQYRVALHGTSDDLVTVTALAEVEDPLRLSSLGVRTKGSANARLSLWTRRDDLDAQLTLSLRRLDYQVLQARSFELKARASGKPSQPHVKAAASLDLLSGRAHADLSYTPQAQELALFVADVDALRLAHVLGTKLPFEQGNLNVDACARRDARDPSHITVDGNLRADLGEAGAIRVRATELRLPAAPTTPRRLTSLGGELVAAGKLDLSKLHRLENLLGFPLERSTGSVRFELLARNQSGQGQPELSLQVDTNGLRIVEQRREAEPVTSTAAAVESKPWALEGIDGHLGLRFHPERGELTGTVIARDRGGTLGKLEGELLLTEAWIRQGGLADALLQAPCKLHLQVEGRRLQSLPPLIRPASLRGRLALDAELSGTLAEPLLRAWLTLDRFRAQGADDVLGVRANVRYTPEQGELFVRALDRRGNQVGRLQTRWQGDLRNAVARPDGRKALVADVLADVERFPLEVVPALVDRQIKGRITGQAALREWGKQARLEARLVGRALTLGTSSLPSLDLKAHNHGERLAAHLSVTTDKGAARAELETEADWGERAVPVLKRRGHARLVARGFELKTLSPMLSSYVSELSGMLDADARVDVSPTETRVAGAARLERGVVQIPAIGQRFSDITAQVAVADNQFELRELTARGLTGRVSASGAARLDGFELRSADAKLSIKEREMLPLTIEGAVLGDVWGTVNLAYAAPERGPRSLDVKVVELRLITPETEGHGLQSLENSEQVRIGTRRADGRFVLLPVQPLDPSEAADGRAQGEPPRPLRISVDLGNKLSVARGQTAQAQLGGKLTIISDGKTKVQGRIAVRGGKLDVQGKTFEIERGVVTFDGTDPSNPTITATARWDGPEYTVYADYVGDVENGRIKLRAEPPLTQDQIASLLLFGDPDGATGSSSDGDSASLAVSVAGETAAKGLNQALGDFTKLDVRARVDTTSGSARPELLWQVSPRVVAKVTRAIGEPAVGESPDRTFLTLELKLRRAWALSAVFGDHGGSALDLIWRHRY
jgi:hypothetical protein